MPGEATITFSQPGVQPPVYVVTSLSEPPWETLEMQVDKDHAEGADLVFSRTFGNAQEGTYQYKIRIGEGHWVVDESKESAGDEQGNRNNVVHVQPAKEVEASSIPSKLIAENSDSASKDSMIESSRTSLPFIAVEKVPAQKQPEYGDTEPSDLPEDHAKRAADAQPDFEDVKPGTPTSQDEASKSSDIPLLVVEKTDDKPAHGDDFGNDATPGQKAAHDKRAADASPDQLIVTTHVEADPFDDLISPKSSRAYGNTELSAAPLLPHEKDIADDDGADELNHGPLLSHEIGLYGGFQESEDGEGDEFDAAPLLPHESSFSQFQNGDATSKSGYTQSSQESEPRHFVYNDKDEYDGHNGNEAPLLPHERDSAVVSQSGSEQGDDDLHMQRKPSYANPTDKSQDLFGRPSIFRVRTNSSSLPHRLPRSDAEDEDLHDPSLERFPTDRANILDRVASIGHQWPEDQTVEVAVHSPVMSVMSQACSSVDLVPVKSYASLASVPEADDPDEEEGVDMESLPSPVVLSFQRSTSSHKRDPPRSTLSDDGNHLGVPEASSSEKQGARAVQPSESDIVNMSDDKDSLATSEETKSETAKTLGLANQPSDTANAGVSTSTETASLEADAELRKRKVVKDDDAASSSSKSTADNKNSESNLIRSVTPTIPKQSTSQLQTDKPSETLFESFVRVVLGPVGRFLTACIGDRKRAGTAAVIVGVGVAVYYFFGSG